MMDVELEFKKCLDECHLEPQEAFQDVTIRLMELDLPSDEVGVNMKLLFKVYETQIQIDYYGRDDSDE